MLTIAGLRIALRKSMRLASMRFALMTFLGWGIFGGDWKQALLIAIAVLIITCPCALGLAVPVVQVVAAGRLFRHGIMVKDGSAMERLAEVETVVFDKTGTLTSGKPRLVASRGKPAHVSMAAALAVHSHHPLSQAIRSVGGLISAVEGVEELAGQGIKAETPSGIYRLGRRSFACPTSADVDTGSYSEVVLSLNETEIASFLFEDTLRSNALNAIEALKSNGYDLMLLSGDRKGAVAQVAVSWAFPSGEPS